MILFHVVGYAASPSPLEVCKIDEYGGACMHENCHVAEVVLEEGHRPTSTSGIETDSLLRNRLRP